MSAKLPAATSQALDLLAHRLRNTAGVVVAGGELLKDGEEAEIGAAVGASGRLLATWLDRLVEAARAEMGNGHRPGPLEVGPLVERSVQRAQRAVPGLVVDVGKAAPDATIVAPAPAAERLVADVLLEVGRMPEPVAVTWSSVGPATLLRATCQEAIGEIETDEDRAAFLLMDIVARSCGAELRREPRALVVEFRGRDAQTET